MILNNDSSRKKMSELQPGEGGVIPESGVDAFPQKMLDLGFVPGEWVFYEGKAPLGDPLFFRVGNQKIAIRKSLAKTIEVDLNGE